MLNRIDHVARTRPHKHFSASRLTITDITSQAAELPDYDNHEKILLGRDKSRGLTAIVAIHDTTLGPALGGTRIWSHPSLEAAIVDAMRLSRGMTYKSAIAGMPFGGGKGVIVADSHRDKTPALLEAYAEMLSALDGEFYTGEDVGLTLADADFLRARTGNVSGTSVGGSGNPSPVTAQGVFLGIRQAWQFATGSISLDGVSVAVQGLGSVGLTLAGKLSAQGASLTVADLDETRLNEFRRRIGGFIVDPDEITGADVDILAPCALGSTLNDATIPSLKARVVAGAANNQLARHEHAGELMKRGILYAPDYVINAGGLINVAVELLPGGYDRRIVDAKVAEIPVTLQQIFKESQKTGLPTNEVARTIALARLNSPGS